jgi:hypothetical protein
MGTPQQFEGFDQIEGLDIADKAVLVGKPLGITAVRFRTNEREVVFAEAEVVTIDGDLCAISDSSTGVRDQLAKYLLDKGHQPSGNTEWIDVMLYVPRGLRVSVYDVEVSGQVKKAKTYYLTTAGRRSPKPEAKPEKPAARGRG